MYIYQRLKDIREDNDLTQKEVAAILETTQRQYSRWETGFSEIPANKIVKLSEFYNVSTDFLLGVPQGRPYGKSITKGG